MSRGNIIALALVASLAVAGVAYLAVPRVRQEADAVISAGGWTLDMWNAITRQLPGLSATSRSIILAHAAYESGFGTARAAQRGANVFNITAGSAWKGPAWDDVGGDVDGAGKRITQRWRIYANLDEAVSDYWNFLGPNANRGRYVHAREALVAGNVAAFVNELHAAGYFELAAPKYLAGLKAVATKLPGPIADAVLSQLP